MAALAICSVCHQHEEAITRLKNPVVHEIETQMATINEQNPHLHNELLLTNSRVGTVEQQMFQLPQSILTNQQTVLDVVNRAICHNRGEAILWLSGLAGGSAISLPFRSRYNSTGPVTETANPDEPEQRQASDEENQTLQMIQHQQHHQQQQYQQQQQKESSPFMQEGTPAFPLAIIIPFFRPDPDDENDDR